MRTRVTEEYLQKRIDSVEYLRIPESTVTICHMVLVNGFSVRGESACVDPHHFEAAVGRKIAYDNAFDKLWALEGYLLAEQLHEHGAKTQLSRVK